jgi:hypothetical protein
MAEYHSNKTSCPVEEFSRLASLVELLVLSRFRSDRYIPEYDITTASQYASSVRLVELTFIALFDSGS